MNIINININNENSNINNKNNDKDKDNNIKSNYIPLILKNELGSYILPIKNIHKIFSIINGSYSNNAVLIENCEAFYPNASENKKLRWIILSNSKKLNFILLYSTVSMIPTIRAEIIMMLLWLFLMGI